MNSDRLWAKRWDQSPPPPSVLLPGHLRDTLDAARKVLDATGDDQLDALCLAPEDFADRFRRIVLFAAAVHDIGKANDHFQGMITCRRDVRVNPQGLRHEWATLLMLWELQHWLLPAVGSDLDFNIAQWAIAGHHPAPGRASPPRDNPSGSGTEIELLMGQRDFQTALVWLQRCFGLSDPPICTNIRREFDGSSGVFASISAWSRKNVRTWDGMKLLERRLVAAVKDCLIAADIAGSALPRALPNDPDRWDWITRAFANRPQSGELFSIAQQRLCGKKPRDFQLRVAGSTTRVTYVRAGCGTGKTLAAYLRAAQQHPNRRLYFCYPTTGNATEGFRDYLFDESEFAPLIGAKLFHSRRDIDFEIILNTGADALQAEADEAARLESLEAWSTPVVACTVDTVLGLLQNHKRGLFSWPALAQSAFVFDEVHAYDDRLFGALLRFLADLPGLPVLLMTASLPAAREEALRELLESQGQPWSAIAGPRGLEQRPRYRKTFDGASGPLPVVRRTLAEGGKVLWVCNTVKRVMDSATGAAELEPLVYHSRFKYEDRVARHQAVIQAFKHSGPALAICSQVAEMSLDLSADLLVTDLAPVPALIQRLGRLNRRAEEGDPTKPFLVIAPDNALPYSSGDLEIACQWLAQLCDKGISQEDLAAAWEQTEDDAPSRSPSAWLDGGPKTAVGQLREASIGITVLMRADIPRIRQTRDIGRFLLPMPKPPIGMNWCEWPRYRGIPIVEPHMIRYDRLRGAEWQES